MKPNSTVVLAIIPILGFLVFTMRTAHAIAPTPTPTPTKQSTTSAELDKIQKIKELVASKVAELKLVEKRGLLGKVTAVSNTQLTIEDLAKQTRIIDIDELTKFQAASSTTKSFGISDIKAQDIISAIGLYNKDTKRLLARFVIQKKPLSIQFEGVVVEKDAKNFKIVVADQSGNKRTIDIEKTTRLQLLSKDVGLVKSGFSKIEQGQRILVTGVMNEKKSDTMTADRIIHFTDIPALSGQTLPPTPTPTIEPSPSPTVSKKLAPTTTKKSTPTTKPTPTPTETQ